MSLRIREKDCVYVKQVASVYCDFCGAKDVMVFESEMEKEGECWKSNMQICFDCVDQLHSIKK